MQAVATTGSGPPVQGFECAPIIGAAAGRQDLQPNLTAEESSFTKLLFKGFDALNAAANSPETEPVGVEEAEAVHEEQPPGDTPAINVFAMCFFAPPQLAHQEPETSETIMAEKVIEDVRTGEPPVQEMPAAETMTQQTQDTQLPKDTSTAVPQVQINRDENKSPEPPRSQEHTQEHQSVASGGVTEKITDVLRSMSGESQGEGDFGKLLSEEKEPAPLETAENEGISGAQTYLQISTQDAQAADKSAAVEKALNGFLEDLRSAKSEGQEIRIVLEPESLGELHISVSRTANGITAQIRSDDREICAIIGNQIQKLVQSMENRGISVENVDVLFGQDDKNMSFAGNSFGGSGEERQPYRGFRGEENIDAADNNSPYYAWKGILDAVDDGNGAVEYRV